MATIITKNSSTASAVPLAGDLVKGELAVNVTDKKLYTKDNGGSVVVVGQEPLISGTNIKTVGGVSILGTGDIAVGTGDVTLTGTQTLTNKTLTSPIITENIQVINTNTNAVASRVYILTASLTLTLPATPAAGDWVVVQNSSGTTTAVIGRNGSNIMSLTENMTLDTLNVAVKLVYADATRGWVFA